jgi:AraC-like DNA-binding protein
MMSLTAGVPISRLSIDALQGLASWRDALQIVVDPSTKYRRNAVGMVLPGLGLMASNASPQTVRRSQHLVTDGNDNLRLIILSRSTKSAVAVHSGREALIEPGAATLLSNSEQHSITFPSYHRKLVVNMRRSALRPLIHDLEGVLARPIPRHVEALRLLSSYIEGLIKQPALNNPDVACLAVTHIYDLAALIIGATRDAAEIAKGRGLRVARLRAIKADIADRLASPDLSVETVAMRQKVSPRYVQLLFEQEGATFSQYVIGQRLVRVHRMLTDSRFADRSITSVAFDAGFNDLSYFNRAFRRCYGGTPSEVRAEAGQRAGREHSTREEQADDVIE